MKKKIRVVAYCRVSTNSRDQKNSFENQKMYFEREIRKNSEYDFTGIYADQGVSGTKLSRPEFDKMLYDAGLDVIEVINNDGDDRKMAKKYVTIPSSTRKPKFDLILVKNTARLARNVLIESILRDLAKVGVYVKFLDLNKSTESQDDSLYIQVFQSIAEKESRDKSKSVIWGQKEGAKHGIINPGHHIYGYNYIKEENRLELIQKEAETIKTIFNLYAEGNGIRKIINRLHDQGVKTRENKDFCKTSIRRILTNEKYMGINARGKYDTGLVFNKNSYPKIRDKNEWFIYEKSDKIPPIVNKEIFDKCQKILENRINYKNQKGIYKGKTKYAGLLYCSSCGKPYISNMDRGRRFYNCSTKKKQGMKACHNDNISSEKLDKIVLRDLRGLSKGVIVGLRHLRILNMRRLKDNNGVQQDKIRDLEEQMNKIELNEERLLELVMENSLSKDLYKKKRNELIEEKRKLEITLKQYKMSEAEILDVTANINASIERHKKIELKAQCNIEEILPEIDKITYFGDDLIYINLKYPTW